VLGISSPDNCSRQYAPPPASSRMQYGPSKLAENLPSFFLALLAILHTRSLMTNDRGRRFALYLLAARRLATKLCIWAFSLSSGRRSRCRAMFW